MTRPLRIFVDGKAVPDGCPPVALLLPFWSKVDEDPNEPESGRFDDYVEQGTSLFEFVGLAEADVVVLPVAWEHVVQSTELREMASSVARSALDVGKVIVIFYVSDSETRYP